MRAILVDDSIIVRTGVARLLTADGHEVIAQLTDARPAIAHAEDLRPDAAILDIRMPPTFTDEGLRLATDLRARFPNLALLVLSQYVVPEYALRLLESGERGSGYLLKDRVLDPTQLTSTLYRLVAGGTVIEPDLVSLLLGQRRERGRLDRLTEREREVLLLMAEGFSDRGIAERLYLSLNTISTL
ncbi:MAG TPA: response regulator transcription factor [Micromonosporaceae bacterium]